jgi:hypothetical protein
MCVLKGLDWLFSQVISDQVHLSLGDASCMRYVFAVSSPPFTGGCSLYALCIRRIKSTFPWGMLPVCVRYSPYQVHLSPGYAPYIPGVYDKSGPIKKEDSPAGKSSFLLS